MASKIAEHPDPKRQAEMARRGVQRAEELFAQYGPEIRAMMEYRVRNRAEAEDVFQEFFLSLATTEVPTDIVNMKSYLSQAIWNDVASWYRQQKRYVRRVEVYAENRNNHRPLQDPSKIVMRKDQERAFFEKITRFLSPQEAKAVTSRYRDECTVAESADQLGIEKRSVTRYVSAGLRKIKQMTGSQGGDV